MSGDGTDSNALHRVSRQLDPRPRLTRSAFRIRLDRLHDRAFLIVQCAVGAAIAWSLARYLLGHAQPFFAAVAVIIALGLTYGQRLRRVVEITVGVAIGVVIGDLFVHLFGTGPLQLGIVVMCAMSLAVLLGAGGLMMVQAGVQAMIVTVLFAGTAGAFSRWIDAVVGGGVALVMATVTPLTPLRRPRVQAGAVLTEFAEVLRESATAGRRRDQRRADAALSRARASEELMDALREATAEGIAVTRQSPFRRKQQANVTAIADITEPLDRALRNIRVLVRRVTVAILEHEVIPPAYLASVDDLAKVMDEMAEELAERRVPQNVRPALLLLSEDVALQSTVGTGRTSLSAEVIRAQLRSIVVDLLMLTGWTYEQVRAEVPHRSDELDL
ncbi:FUSC family protein [Demetria terragena]|uniref:FUSC family protein n=1 Tax=Demetria terragena TaxID=63959 RepID=UPI000375BE39|nr:FUSC family protein [Demetria terragena]